MPPKLAEENKRAHVNLPTELLDQIDPWRGSQQDPPNLSELIRELIELGLVSARKGGKHGR